MKRPTLAAPTPRPGTNICTTHVPRIPSQHTNLKCNRDKRCGCQLRQLRHSIVGRTASQTSIFCRLWILDVLIFEAQFLPLIFDEAGCWLLVETVVDHQPSTDDFVTSSFFVVACRRLFLVRLFGWLFGVAVRFWTIVVDVFVCPQVDVSCWLLGGLI